MTRGEIIRFLRKTTACRELPDDLKKYLENLTDEKLHDLYDFFMAGKIDLFEKTLELGELISSERKSSKRKMLKIENDFVETVNNEYEMDKLDQLSNI